MKRKNEITEIIFLLDRSGSMAGLEGDTIGGFNSMIQQQKSKSGKCYVSTVLFDHVSEVIHDRVELSDVKEMTSKDYFVRGNTALMDAIGDSIRHIGNVHKYARAEDVPQKTLFVITTDGYENASRKYNREDIKNLIERQQKKYDWEFLFIGANIDAVETASEYGISAERAVDYHCDSIGTGLLYQDLSDAIDCVRACKPLEAQWSRRMSEDFKRRK